MRVVVLLCFLGTSLALNAQIEFRRLESTGRNDPMDINYIMNPENTKGSPLGFEDWRLGRAVVDSGDTSEFYYINYHTLGDVVYFRERTTKDLYKIEDAKVSHLLLNDDEGDLDVFQRIPWQSFEEFPDYPRYCELLLIKEGFELIKYFDKELEEAEKKDVSRVVRADEYKSRIRYFWRDHPDLQYKKVNFNKSWIRNVLNKEQHDRMKAYQKENKVRWSRENEVIKMLKAII